MKSKVLWGKGFAAGFIAAVICSAGLVFAADGLTSVTAYLNSKLHMTFNNTSFKPTEADGSELPAILYKDRTYLPVRAVAEKAGVYVNFDSSTSEVILKSENEILNRAYLTLHYLKYRDFEQLATLIHKDKGLTFSPYAFVEKDAVKFTATQIKSLKLTDKYLWGEYDGSANPMDLSAMDYFDRFVFNHDFIQAPKIGIDTLVQTGNTITNLDKAFPGAHFVEFNFSGFDPKFDGVDWASLRLVFEKAGGQWMLIGIVHDSWTV